MGLIIFICYTGLVVSHIELYRVSYLGRVSIKLVMLFGYFTNVLVTLQNSLIEPLSSLL